MSDKRQIQYQRFLFLTIRIFEPSAISRSTMTMRYAYDHVYKYLNIVHTSQVIKVKSDNIRR